MDFDVVIVNTIVIVVVVGVNFKWVIPCSSKMHTLKAIRVASISFRARFLITFIMHCTVTTRTFYYYLANSYALFTDRTYLFN